jgi:hypothetical protein
MKREKRKKRTENISDILVFADDLGQERDQANYEDWKKLLKGK